MKRVTIGNTEKVPSDKPSALSQRAQSAHTRDAMGKYTGEAPLTILEQPFPSGFDYQPSTSLTTRKRPEYSITGKPYPKKSEQRPTPGDHEIAGDMSWDSDKKTFIVSPKGKTWPYGPREDAHLTCSTGAGHYKVVYGDTGSGIKQSVSSRHKGGINVGPPNSSVQPVDTFGVKTPGPDYRPNSPYWGRGPQHHIGVRLKPKSAETPGPGPGAYALPSDVDSITGPLIGEQLYRENDPEYPAPNAYDIPETVGTGLKKSFGIMYDDVASKNKNPPPNRYYIRNLKGNAPSMTYRAFPWPLETRPGPSDHDPVAQSIHPRASDYSCRKKCLPVFPDILNYSAEYETVSVPGAGEYNYDRDFQENSNPAYSMGTLLPAKPNDHPGPNHYHLQHTNRSNIARVPSYTMGQTLSKPKNKGETPAPWDYQPDVDNTKLRVPTYSMTPRRKDSNKSKGPSPNAYNISRGQTHKGSSTGKSCSFSSRHSPHQYAGFPTAALARL
ncbi:uncharacterized protein [Dysidea avara]|uniref:uncharacterized protein n=1 Tax=Dysidea avara TaxID=196820 RepID=UPI00331C22A2